MLAAVWDEDGAVRAAISFDPGKAWSMLEPLTGEVGALNPRIVAAADGFLALWTRSDAAGRRVLEMRRVSIPR
jgi:hypothetical protein